MPVGDGSLVWDKEHTSHTCKWVSQSCSSPREGQGKQGRVPQVSPDWQSQSPHQTLSSRLGLGWPSPHPAVGQCSVPPWTGEGVGKTGEKNLPGWSKDRAITQQGCHRQNTLTWQDLVSFLPINFNYLYPFLSPQVTLSPQVSPFLSHAHMPLLHSL